MLIYLLRHGIAVERGKVAYPNDDRPLTDQGRKKAERNARGIAEVMGGVTVILTSPLLRAAETATITAGILSPGQQPEPCRDLAPGGSVAGLLGALARRRGMRAVLLVGHEPDLGYVAAHLLGTASPVIRFKKGGLCCIETDALPPRKPGVLHWHLTPKQLRKIGTP